MAKKQADDQIFKKAKTKLSNAIEAIDAKQPGGVADLVKLCETLATMKEVELKAQAGGFGDALGDSA
jgi:hypothetical protein